MVDKYRFNVPIEFEFTIPGGVDNPDLRSKLKEEVSKVLHTLVRTKENQLLFDYPATMDDKKMHVSCWTGYISTKHAPNRFRSREINIWKEIASELESRAKNDYGGNKHIKTNIIRKADVPFYIGRWARQVWTWLQKYEYITFKQEELMRVWAKKYNVRTKLPELVVILPKKKTKKISKSKKAWIALSSELQTF